MSGLTDQELDRRTILRLNSEISALKVELKACEGGMLHDQLVAQAQAIERLKAELRQVNQDAVWAMAQLHSYLPTTLDTEASRVHDRIVAFLQAKGDPPSRRLDPATPI